MARQESLVVCDDIADPATLDPQKEFVEKNHTILQQIFDGLARINPEGKIEPSLATDWRWVDDRTLELHLRRGVAFHDGEAFDAKAVQFTLERYLDPRTGFPALGYLDSIEHVTAVDPYTVRIKTKYPDGILMNRLAGFILISPPDYIAKFGEEFFSTHPVGTGPFRFVEWDKMKQITLAANGSYWDGPPDFGTLTFRFLPPKTQVAKLLSGEVDVVTELPGTDTLKVLQSGVATVIKKKSFYTVASSINISTGPLSDIRVRQALNYAINKEELIRYDLLGNGAPLASITMQGEIGHNPDLRPYPYDPAKARRLLRDAGFPRGLQMKVIIKAQTERAAKILTKQLERVGIRLEIVPSPDATLSRDIQKGTWDFTFGGCPDPLSHSFFVQSIFLFSRSPFSILRNSTYDKKLLQMVSTLDSREQQRLGMELDEYVYRQALSLFTYQKIRVYGVKKGVHFVPSITGMPHLYLTEVNHGTRSR